MINCQNDVLDFKRTYAIMNCLSVCCCCCQSSIGCCLTDSFKDKHLKFWGKGYVWPPQKHIILYQNKSVFENFIETFLLSLNEQECYVYLEDTKLSQILIEARVYVLLQNLWELHSSSHKSQQNTTRLHITGAYFYFVVRNCLYRP